MSASPDSGERRRFKYEPLLAMLALIFLGLWLVISKPGTGPAHELRPGATAVKFVIGQYRGHVEILMLDGQATFRMLSRDHASEVLTESQFAAIVGEEAVHRLRDGGNMVFRALNITGWGSLVWVAVGLLGQIIFSCRFVIQWLVSERERRSVIPEVFWWISLLGGICLFVYFVWRQDIIGVLGQSSGVVIYARNLRLIAKQRRRAASA
ncbi:MAG: lipid-A-disaccharide synthase N-terminal domain-containing protein [Phycisphaeraceae bacterium]|nr:lipid-A-disaccharide synthase N-terminal domain-containing protein [Phycisphaeraceae bacterium]